MIRKKLKLACDALDLSSTENSDIVANDGSDQTTSNTKISKFFVKTVPELLWEKVYDIECKMNDQLRHLEFLSPVSAVYNPIEYAASIHCEYLKKGLHDRFIPILMIGMNPGPWGMCQTGVPFGYIPAVRDWMKLTGEVSRPQQEIASRPVTGLHCNKAERSGQRFWGLFQDICGDTDENFFKNCFVYNYCPLAFFEKSGRNITPAELKGDIRRTLQTICSSFMNQIISLISPDIIISIGRYAEDRVNSSIKSKSINGTIIHKCMLHPSPRSINNTNWNSKAQQWLIDNDIIKYFKN